MKKFNFIFFLIFMFCTFSCVYASNINIVISPQKVMVDNVQKDFEVYNIDGNNFFKLRDIAYVLNQTNSQFSVDYNSEKSLIEVQKGKPYIPLGSEMKNGVDNSKSAVKSMQKLYINDELKDITAYNIGGNNFFKLRELGAILNFEVDYDSVNNKVMVSSIKDEITTNITNVVTKIFNGVMYVEITTDRPVNDYNSFVLADPNRIILDISNSNLEVLNKEILINYGGISKLRLGNQGNMINRVVVDLDKLFDYKIVQSADKKITCIALSKDFNYTDLSLNPEKILLVSNGITIPIYNNQNNETFQSGDSVFSGDNNNLTEEELKNRVKITSIKYSSSTNKIKITGNKNFEYDDFIIENPYRVVIDIKNSVLDVEGPTTITPNNKNISVIRFSQKDSNVVRVVFELKAEAEYNIKESDDLIEVSFKEATYKNLSYNASKDDAYITLYNVKKSVFSVTESSSSNKYTLKFSESRFECGKEILEIDDEFIDTIEMKTGKIIIQGKDNVSFKMKQDGDNVVITISSKTSNIEDGDFVVLIDAGHGGSDPGACHDGSRDPNEQEKTYTLAIMLKLKKLLEKTEGITVRASRTTDEYIGIEGRIGFVLDNIEDADMLVSVHINSHSVKQYKGTMVLFYDKPNEKEDYGITSKELATLIKNNLVSDLELQDRGVVSRNDLWILEQNAAGKISERSGEVRPVTNLPAVLCELCFISNDEEFARLQTEEFQEDAALAIYNGIIEAKAKMGK